MFRYLRRIELSDAFRCCKEIVEISGLDIFGDLQYNLIREIGELPVVAVHLHGLGSYRIAEYGCIYGFASS